MADGPPRTRTCNQTIMSGGIMVVIVKFAAFSVTFDRVCCALLRSFWCETGAVRIS